MNKNDLAIGGDGYDQHGQPNNDANANPARQGWTGEITAAAVVPTTTTGAPNSKSGYHSLSGMNIRWYGQTVGTDMALTPWLKQVQERASHLAANCQGDQIHGDQTTWPGSSITLHAVRDPLPSAGPKPSANSPDVQASFYDTPKWIVGNVQYSVYQKALQAWAELAYPAVSGFWYLDANDSAGVWPYKTGASFAHWENVKNPHQSVAQALANGKKVPSVETSNINDEYKIGWPQRNPDGTFAGITNFSTTGPYAKAGTFYFPKGGVHYNHNASGNFARGYHVFGYWATPYPQFEYPVKDSIERMLVGPSYWAKDTSINAGVGHVPPFAGIHFTSSIEHSKTQISRLWLHPSDPLGTKSYPDTSAWDFAVWGNGRKDHDGDPNTMDQFQLGDTNGNWLSMEQCMPYETIVSHNSTGVLVELDWESKENSSRQQPFWSSVNNTGYKDDTTRTVNQNGKEFADAIDEPEAPEDTNGDGIIDTDHHRDKYLKLPIKRNTKKGVSYIRFEIVRNDANTDSVGLDVEWTTSSANAKNEPSVDQLLKDWWGIKPADAAGRPVLYDPNHNNNPWKLTTGNWSNYDKGMIEIPDGSDKEYVYIRARRDTIGGEGDEKFIFRLLDTTNNFGPVDAQFNEEATNGDSNPEKSLVTYGNNYPTFVDPQHGITDHGYHSAMIPTRGQETGGWTLPLDVVVGANPPVRYPNAQAKAGIGSQCTLPIPAPKLGTTNFNRKKAEIGQANDFYAMKEFAFSVSDGSNPIGSCCFVRPCPRQQQTSSWTSYDVTDINGTVHSIDGFDDCGGGQQGHDDWNSWLKGDDGRNLYCLRLTNAQCKNLKEDWENNAGGGTWNHSVQDWVKPDNSEANLTNRNYNGYHLRNLLNQRTANALAPGGFGINWDWDDNFRVWGANVGAISTSNSEAPKWNPCVSISDGGSGPGWSTPQGADGKGASYFDSGCNRVEPIIPVAWTKNGGGTSGHGEWANDKEKVADDKIINDAPNAPLHWLTNIPHGRGNLTTESGTESCNTPELWGAWSNCSSAASAPCEMASKFLHSDEHNGRTFFPGRACANINPTAARKTDNTEYDDNWDNRTLTFNNEGGYKSDWWNGYLESKEWGARNASERAGSMSPQIGYWRQLYARECDGAGPWGSCCQTLYPWELDEAGIAGNSIPKMECIFEASYWACQDYYSANEERRGLNVHPIYSNTISLSRWYLGSGTFAPDAFTTEGNLETPNNLEVYEFGHVPALAPPNDLNSTFKIKIEVEHIGANNMKETESFTTGKIDLITKEVQINNMAYDVFDSQLTLDIVRTQINNLSSLFTSEVMEYANEHGNHNYFLKIESASNLVVITNCEIIDQSASFRLNAGFFAPKTNRQSVYDETGSAFWNRTGSKKQPTLYGNLGQGGGWKVKSHPVAKSGSGDSVEHILRKQLYHKLTWAKQNSSTGVWPWKNHSASMVPNENLWTEKIKGWGGTWKIGLPPHLNELEEGRDYNHNSVYWRMFHSVAGTEDMYPSQAQENAGIDILTDMEEDYAYQKPTPQELPFHDPKRTTQKGAWRMAQPSTNKAIGCWNTTSALVGGSNGLATLHEEELVDHTIYELDSQGDPTTTVAEYGPTGDKTKHYGHTVPCLRGSQDKGNQGLDFGIGQDLKWERLTVCVDGSCATTTTPNPLGVCCDTLPSGEIDCRGNVAEADCFSRERLKEPTGSFKCHGKAPTATAQGPVNLGKVCPPTRGWNADFLNQLIWSISDGTNIERASNGNEHVTWTRYSNLGCKGPSSPYDRTHDDHATSPPGNENFPHSLEDYREASKWDVSPFNDPTDLSYNNGECFIAKIVANTDDNSLYSTGNIGDPNLAGLDGSGVPLWPFKEGNSSKSWGTAHSKGLNQNDWVEVQQRCLLKSELTAGAGSSMKWPAGTDLAAWKGDYDFGTFNGKVNTAADCLQIKDDGGNDAVWERVWILPLHKNKTLGGQDINVWQGDIGHPKASGVKWNKARGLGSPLFNLARFDNFNSSSVNQSADEFDDPAGNKYYDSSYDDMTGLRSALEYEREGMTGHWPHISADWTAPTSSTPGKYDYKSYFRKASTHPNNWTGANHPCSDAQRWHMTLGGGRGSVYKETYGGQNTVIPAGSPHAGEYTVDGVSPYENKYLNTWNKNGAWGAYEEDSFAGYIDGNNAVKEIDLGDALKKGGKLPISTTMTDASGGTPNFGVVPQHDHLYGIPFRSDKSLGGVKFPFNVRYAKDDGTLDKDVWPEMKHCWVPDVALGSCCNWPSAINPPVNDANSHALCVVNVDNQGKFRYKDKAGRCKDRVTEAQCWEKSKWMESGTSWEPLAYCDSEHPGTYFTGASGHGMYHATLGKITQCGGHGGISWDYDGALTTVVPSHRDSLMGNYSMATVGNSSISVWEQDLNGDRIAVGQHHTVKWINDNNETKYCGTGAGDQSECECCSSDWACADGAGGSGGGQGSGTPQPMGPGVIES